MTWIDLTSIMFALLTIILVFRATRQIKLLLADARYERLDIHRRLEKLGRRLDAIDGGPGDGGTGDGGIGDPSRI